MSPWLVDTEAATDADWQVQRAGRACAAAAPPLPPPPPLLSLAAGAGRPSGQKPVLPSSLSSCRFTRSNSFLYSSSSSSQYSGGGGEPEPLPLLVGVADAALRRAAPPASEPSSSSRAPLSAPLPGDTAGGAARRPAVSALAPSCAPPPPPPVRPGEQGRPSLPPAPPCWRACFPASAPVGCSLTAHPPSCGAAAAGAAPAALRRWRRFSCLGTGAGAAGAAHSSSSRPLPRRASAELYQGCEHRRQTPGCAVSALRLAQQRRPARALPQRTEQRGLLLQDCLAPHQRPCLCSACVTGEMAVWSSRSGRKGQESSHNQLVLVLIGMVKRITGFKQAALVHLK